MDEQWRPVVGYEGFYEVSSFGGVRSVDREIVDSFGVRRRLPGKVIRQNTSSWGYLVVWLSVASRQKLVKVHRLVAQAFVQNPLGLKQVNHKDGEKMHNHVGNLEWCDGKHNVQHAIRTGLKKFQRGEDIYIAKVTESQVQEIRARRKRGEKLKPLAEAFGLSESATWSIITRKNWAHVPEL